MIIRTSSINTFWESFFFKKGKEVLMILPTRRQTIFENNLINLLKEKVSDNFGYYYKGTVII